MYSDSGESASRCVDFYSNPGNDTYILLEHDDSNLPINSIESVHEKGKTFIEILRSDKQSGSHETYSYKLTEQDHLILTMSHFTWNDKDQ